MIICPHCAKRDSALFAGGLPPYEGLNRYCLRCGGFSVFYQASHTKGKEWRLRKLSRLEYEEITHLPEAFLLRVIRLHFLKANEND
jgi:hypothetical protein